MKFIRVVQEMPLLWEYLYIVKQEVYPITLTTFSHVNAFIKSVN